MNQITVYGAQISPYVRKVRLSLALAGVDYEQVFVIPHSEDAPEEFKANNPLGKIPLMRVNDNWLHDSSVMCAWIEREYPQGGLLPEDNMAAARSLWFEEYADSHMTAVCGGHLFAEVILAPMLFKREPIQSDIDAALNHEIPAILDYLESELNDDYLTGSAISLGDLAVGSQFVTLSHCDYSIDSQRWPKAAAYRDRLLSSELFAPIVQEEVQLLNALQQA